MSNHSSHVHVAPVRDHHFTQAVGLRIREDWVFLESARQALACLQDLFEDKTGPSYLRATSTCSAVLSAQLPPDAAQATFLVAAMEAGIVFEVVDDTRLVLEREVEAAAAKGLEELFLAQAAE